MRATENLQGRLRKRPVVATAGARPNDCKVSETVSSRAGGDRLLTLHCCRSAQTAERRQRVKLRVLWSPDRRLVELTRADRHGDVIWQAGVRAGPNPAGGFFAGAKTGMPIPGARCRAWS